MDVQGNLYKSQENSKRIQDQHNLKNKSDNRKPSLRPLSQPLITCHLELYQRWPQHSPCAGQWEGSQQHSLQTRKNVGMRNFGSSFWILLFNKLVNYIQFQKQILQTETIIFNLCYWGLILGLHIQLGKGSTTYQHTPSLFFFTFNSLYCLFISILCMSQLLGVSYFLPPLGFGVDFQSSGLLVCAFNCWACSWSMALNSFCSPWGPWPCNPVVSAS